MFSNYCQGTVDPYLPKDWFTDKDKENLEAQGFEFVDAQEKDPKIKDHYYIYASEDIHQACEEHGEEIDNCPYWEDIFQNILKRKNSDGHIIVEAAFYGAEMNMGEFGGFCAVITKDRSLGGSTKSLIDEALKKKLLLTIQT